jgi:hypothetical protein
VDFERRAVTVHRLAGDGYAVHGELANGQRAKLTLLSGFNVDVALLFATVSNIPE